ncbi:DUF4342 domain-containing protein [Candidatus Bathyarchaeota archaeon]|nr:DUF4342 domain-containing protein [Candidatus Bathyarchaeota archaeon]
MSEEARFCSACGTPVTKTTSEEVSVASENLIKRVKEILHEGNVTRIIIKDENDKVLLEIPATIGVIGVLIAPWLAALGAIAGIATNAKITIIREE